MATVMDKVFRVWNSEGWHFEIGPDEEDLGLIEVRYIDSDGPSTPLLICKEDALLIGQALIELAGGQPR